MLNLTLFNLLYFLKRAKVDEKALKVVLMLSSPLTLFWSKEFDL